MLTENHLSEIRNRVQLNSDPKSTDLQTQDTLDLLAEVDRLRQHVRDFTASINAKVTDLEQDMIQLEAHNSNLRKMNESAFFERDATISLAVKLAHTRGFKTGVLGNRVAVELPSGQVYWDFMESEAHLFNEIPKLDSPITDQTIQDNYLKIMNPGLEFKDN